MANNSCCQKMPGIGWGVECIFGSTRRTGPWNGLKSKQKKSGEEPAVIEAWIQLRACLNLLDMERMTDLDYATSNLFANHEVMSRLRNTTYGAHFLDRAVIDSYCERMAHNEVVFQTVLACFPEGVPLYPTSKIPTKAHVQIAVRDLNCIQSVRMVEF